MSYTSNEVKSGIFVTFSLAILLALIFVIGRWATGATYTYYLRFGYVSGLEKNAPVYVAGTEMGKVDSIKIESDNEKSILVTVRVPQNIVLREDCEAFIDTLGMMGEKFVELSPGSIQAPALKPGSMIQGLDPIPMHQIIEKMNVLADRMDELTVSLNPLIGNMNTMLKGNEEQIAKMIANFEVTSANIRDITTDLKKRPWRLVRKS